MFFQQTDGVHKLNIGYTRVSLPVLLHDLYQWQGTIPPLSTVLHKLHLLSLDHIIL